MNRLIQYMMMLTVFTPLIQMEKDLRDLEFRISSLGSSENRELTESLLKSYSNLQEKFNNSNGFGYKSRIKGVLKGLGFEEEDYDKPVSLLSGGQKTRIALGKILLQDFNILLLDEPTNYLDIESVEWLKNILKTLNAQL